MAATPDPLETARSYWDRIRGRYPEVRALILRNPLADFVPGISDLDLRLVADPDPEGDWQALTEAVAEVHLERLSEGPAMWRLLEHPPGACVTLGEALSSQLFHPEMRQWQRCCGDAATLDLLEDHIATAPWSAQDDLYWERRLRGYLGPWGPPEDRINLAAGMGNRYRLHALLMLHTLPALQAAYCLLHQKAVPGKAAALKAWQALRPGDPLLTELADMLATGFRSHLHIRPEALEALQGRCRRLVDEVAAEALKRGSQRGPERPAGDGAHQPVLDLFDAVRYSRMRPAHYRSFLLAPEGFQVDFFLVNEVATLRRSIVEPVVRALWSPGQRLGTGDREAESDPLRRLCRTGPEERAVTAALIAARASPSPAEARQILGRLLGLYPLFHRVLERALAANCYSPRPDSV
ncbi:MAG: hypothetical protein HPY83_14785 [Anaerolineae bacterium]|nr:hypothetical protein [Anaerolineae bacterium]